MLERSQIEMNRPDGKIDPRVKTWWDNVLAGGTSEAHPVHGDRVHARVRNGRLEVSGRLEQPRDVEQVADQARMRAGHGVAEVDTSGLRVADRHERPALYDQTLVAAYPDRATAELAKRLIDEHARVRPESHAIVDRTNISQLRDVLPPAHLDDARRRIDRGEALLVLRVDETRAYTVRSLMEEETRSVWTTATPPEPARRG